jgi:hypothetical protein
MMPSQITLNKMSGHAYKGPQRVGIELELENFPLEPNFIYTAITKNKWSITTDGSLRNHGIELRCAEPMTLDVVRATLPKVLEHILKVSKDNGRTPDPSYRCSTHVHVDMGAYSVEQMHNIMGMYLILEPYLFQRFNIRANSNFCVPLYKSTVMRRWYSCVDAVYSVRPMEGMNALAHREIRHVSEMWAKYTALNLSRLRDLGTFEWRHAPAWITPEPIMAWTTWVATFTEMAANVNIIKEIDGYLQTPVRYTSDVMDFPTFMLGENTMDAHEAVLIQFIDSLERRETLRQAMKLEWWR